jgi:hypothetical protein
MKKASIILHHCELSELTAVHKACHITYEKIVELYVCRDVHQVAIELDLCFAIS